MPIRDRSRFLSTENSWEILSIVLLFILYIFNPELTFLLLCLFVVSCYNIEFESIENDLNDFMDWALSDTVIESAQSYSTISSSG